MDTDVIVLNGASSSGKSTIALSLQSGLKQPYLTFGVDTLVEALPRSLNGAGLGIAFGPDGQVEVGLAFRQLEDAWYQGLSAMARAGAGLILDEVFLDGAASQRRLDSALTGLQVLWVAVHCDLAVAVAREAARPDRTVGMAASQAHIVHKGVTYDLHVDTTSTSASDCAQAIAAKVLT